MQSKKPDCQSDDLEMQMRILKQRQDLERDASIVQTAVLIGLWLLTAMSVIIYAM